MRLLVERTVDGQAIYGEMSRWRLASNGSAHSMLRGTVHENIFVADRTQPNLKPLIAALPLETEHVETEHVELVLRLRGGMETIRELVHTEANAAIQTLRESVLDSCKPAEIPSAPSDSDIDTSDWHSPQRTKQERWNKRLESTVAMLEDMEQQSYKKRKVIGCFVDGKPVGVLSMTNGEPPLIHDMVTHPDPPHGSKGIGGRLIERAVHISKNEFGKGGRLILASLDDESKKAYEALGFKPYVTDTTFILKPHKAKEKWCEHEGEWRLKKNVDNKAE